mmetsp:Transcript_32230/g.47626  ORF Transcript_32230/g.47626 Transcript_32230/m.47626 type:complete len:302 (+) Transcript_32230:90-995(+)
MAHNMATAEEESGVGNSVEDILREETEGNDNEGNSCHDSNNVEEPATKKARASSASPRERNKYKGMRIRQCLCAQPECLPRLKGWIDLGDSKRQGFKELPRQSSKTTPVGLEKNRIRDIMFQHIRGTKAPRYEESDKTNRERKLFVAYHHFHPLMLQEGNLGPMQHIYFELAERIGGFHENDTVQSHTGIIFHAIPNYPKELQIRDFEQAGGVEHQRYARPRSKSKASDDQLPKARKAQNMKNRVREVLGQMERDPLKVANEYIEMKERLNNIELPENSGGQVREAADEENEQFRISIVNV